MTILVGLDVHKTLSSILTLSEFGMRGARSYLPGKQDQRGYG